MLGPSARAQYSGGGWTAQPNPQHPSLYDWTGLTETATYTPGQTFTTPVYGGVSPSSMGTSNGVSEYTLLVNGTSTYYWLWSPPASDAGAPAPPLYALVSNSATASVGVRSSNTDGLSATVYMNTGTGHATLPCSAPPFPANWSLSERQVVAAQSSGSSAWVPVSPSLSADLKSTLPSGSQMMGGYQVTEGVFPIVLSWPDPFGRPDLGDGSNQYVYDASIPKGNLILPGVIAIPGATSDDATWLVNDPAVGQSHVNVMVDLPAESVLTASHLQPSAGQVSYQYGSTSPYTSGMWFVGLPKNNSGFSGPIPPGGTQGPNYHLVTLTVDGKNSQQAHIQTFFTGATTDTNQNVKYIANYPGADGTIPNWYYYYNQASPSPGSYDTNNTYPQFSAYTDTWSPFNIHMEASTYTNGASSRLPVFDIDPTADALTQRNYVRWVGNISLQGIDCYTYICVHEQGHQAIHKMGGIYTDSPAAGASEPLTGDGDHVLDTWEATHHLRYNPSDPKSTDTTGACQGYAAPGDDELLADIKALQPVLTSRDLWKLDWADKGLQFTGGIPLYWYATQIANGQVVTPPATNPTFYWKFKPLVNGTPAASSKVQPFLTGTTANPNPGPFHDGTYPIQSLSDLQAQYPSLLTDLPSQE